MSFKRALIIAAFALGFPISACNSENGTTMIAGDKYRLVAAFPKLSFTRPVDLRSAGDGTGRLFVVEQQGRILVFDNDAATDAKRVFLSLSVNDEENEEGLLGLAFDPQFASNRYYYVYYTVKVANERKSRLSRFEADATQPDTTMAGSQVDLLTIDQDFSNHNGGGLAFGPDGMLYIGVGDGGSGNDPNNRAQDRAELLGNILRIDVSSAPYSIPGDNPFVGNTDGHREEIFAWGFRNPWRISFDTPTGRLWVGDVGQNAWEEIDIVASGQNYGWKIMEAKVCRPPTSGCNMSGLTLPVWQYPHPPTGGRSISGGYVYRGSTLPDLVGAYIYADFLTGQIWALRVDPGTDNDLVLDTNIGIASFGVDENDELYICSFDGTIYMLEDNDTE